MGIDGTDRQTAGQTPDHHINPAADYVSSVSKMSHRRTANRRRTNEPSFLMTSQIYNNKFFFKQSAHHLVSHATTNRMLLTDNNTNIMRSIALTTKPAARPQELSVLKTAMALQVQLTRGQL